MQIVSKLSLTNETKSTFRKIIDRVLPVIQFNNSPETTTAAEPESTTEGNSSPSSNVESLSAFNRQMYEDNNFYRSLHVDTPAAVWDESLAASAQQAANTCAFKHTKETNPSFGSGENIYYTTNVNVDTSNPANAKEISRMWYEEIALYDYANPGFSSATGHFTQMVWTTSTRIGCGYTVCTNGISDNGNNRPGLIAFCHYSVPGNVQGEFATHVLPTTA